ncbi:GAF domain-containing sensor histidine kinase [Gordonia sp. C13]|uniref:GAF domain-containing sensor histidine kinase n=1 Tax=Gordonia sp. C13 TaxID=2935078 RepID=UPI0035A82378
MSEAAGRGIPASWKNDRGPLRDRVVAVVLRPTSPRWHWGVATALVLIAVEVVVVQLLREIFPENAFGAVFLFGVLVVSARWGFPLAVATSAASAAAYAWFHARQSTDSAAPAVVVFLVLALLTNALVGQARLHALESDQRRREADLSADLARTVLRAADLPEALTAASIRLTEVLDLPAPGAVLADPGTTPGPVQQHIALLDRGRSVGSLLVPADLDPADRRRVSRMVPSLEALLAAALDRQALNDRTVALARQQVALRRVATAVASRSEPGEVCRIVAAELADELGVEHVTVVRFTDDADCEVLATRDDSTDSGLSVGERLALGGTNVSTLVAETGEMSVLDYSTATGPIADRLEPRGLRTGIGAPITVDEQPWGAVIVGTTHRSAPAELRLRLGDFADLVATAIYNSEARAALTRSRARVIAAADQARRTIERDLHDGAQQRIVSLGLDIRALQATVPDDQTEVRERLDTVVDSLAHIHRDLQELSRGIHPAILSRGGLGPALRTLARRSSVPVALQATDLGRMSKTVEVTAYYVVAESLTNTAKYAQASEVVVSAHVADDTLTLSVTDDGIGGALPDKGSGLLGLRDRVEAVEGELVIDSPPREGTTVRARIPLTETSTTG